MIKHNTLSIALRYSRCMEHGCNIGFTSIRTWVTGFCTTQKFSIHFKGSSRHHMYPVLQNFRKEYGWLSPSNSMVGPYTYSLQPDTWCPQVKIQWNNSKFVLFNSSLPDTLFEYNSDVLNIISD